MKLLFIQAGGTIDKGYPSGDDNHGYNFEIIEPAFNSILERINLDYEFDAETVIKKDSLDMTDKDREHIKMVCAQASNKRIVITHGTDTMLKTAAVLSGVPDKTIVLTGSLLPERFKDSDADFNLGFAVASAGILANGVYIAMSGRAHEWNKVVFDTERNRFTAAT